MSAIRLLIGLGNPGAEYQYTRHNAGSWYVESLARQLGISLRADKKYHGYIGNTTLNGQRVYLLIPTTFMNRSGKSSSALANFFRIKPEEILVAHDELDIPPGDIRIKRGGGHGGHNGLRDIIACHGNNRDFMRLRVGVGHPGNSQLVTPWVLGKPSPDDQQHINAAIDQALTHTDDILAGHFNRVMSTLNSFHA